jgi:Caspase domain
MLKRHLPSLLLPVLVAALLALSVRAHAQTRIALVIGNSAYQKVANLANPAHDAQDVSESLRRLGFTVNTVTDADFDGFRRALRDFGRMAPNAEMAVFYFAGHGVEIDGNNWLLPTDAELRSDVDARTEAIGLRSAMEAVAAAKTLGLVILDACRNNPFSTMRRAATRSVQMLGLAPVEPADNVLVAYAARDGTVAADGAGRNSPYAAAFLKHIETPGLEVDFLFRNIRDDVMAATKNEQQPFVYGSLSSTEIYFKPPPVVAAAVDATPPPDAAEIAWSFLRATNDVSTLTRFVDRFPESSHVSDAKVRIASLATAPAPGATDVSPLLPGQVVAFADTEFAQAEKAVARRFVRDTPAVEQAWDVLKETKDHTVIRHFVDRFPSKERRVVADTRLTALGQKPITVHVTAPQLLDVNEDVLAMAAADPDVLECFRRGDQTADACQKAFQRFPDIGHFAEDIRFTLGFCQAMGNPGGCVPTVKTAWNFPNMKLPVQTDPPRPCPTCRKIGSGNPQQIPNNAASIVSATSASKSIPGGNGGHFHHHINTGALKLQQGNGSSGNTTHFTATGSKITNLKATGIKVATPSIKTLTTPAVKPPDVKINLNLRIPTPRVPTISIR